MHHPAVNEQGLNDMPFNSPYLKGESDEKARLQNRVNMCWNLSQFKDEIHGSAKIHIGFNKV